MAAPRAKPTLPVNYEAQLAAEAADIAKRIAAPSGDRIKFKGNTALVTPDGMEGDTIEVVIVDFVSVNLYYDTAYDAGNPMSPACFAISTEPKLMAPSSNSPSKQADNCTVCPNNAFGSAGKGKACKNTRLLAMIPTSALDSPDAEAPIWIMSIPPTSLKSFDSYVSSLASKHKTVPIGVVTQITLDRKMTYASPRFDVIRPLKPNEFGTFMQRRDEALTRLSAEPDTSNYTTGSKPAGRGAPPRRR